MPRPRQIVPTFGYNGQMYMRNPQTEAPLYCAQFPNPELENLPEEEREEARNKDEFPDVWKCWVNAYEFSTQSENYQVFDTLPPDALLPPLP